MSRTHQGRMQRRRHAPYSLEPDDASERKRSRKVHERRTGELAECQGRADSRSRERDRAGLLLPWSEGDDGFLHLESLP